MTFPTSFMQYVNDTREALIVRHEWEVADYVAHLVGHPFSVLAGLCWFVVAIGAAAAIFAKSVRDTGLEMVALAFISLCAVSRAFYVLGRGVLPADAVATAVALALYVIIVWLKLRRAAKAPRRRCTDVPDAPKRRQGDPAP